MKTKQTTRRVDHQRTVGSADVTTSRSIAIRLFRVHTQRILFAIALLLLTAPTAVRGTEALDGSSPLLTCPPSKTVACGQPWTFDVPTHSEECVFDSLVYDNSVNDRLVRFNPEYREVGDEILLEGTNRQPTRFVFEYWGTNRQHTAFDGAVTARVRFYENDGTEFNGYPTPGTLLYDSGAFPVQTTPRATLAIEDFELDALTPLLTPLPNRFTWSVQFAGQSTNDAVGLDLYSPPVVGQSYPDYWERTSAGWQLKTNSLAPSDFAARIEAASNNVHLTVVSTVTNAVSGCSYIATRTWQAIDPSGHTEICSQTVTVQDPTPPQVTAYLSGAVPGTLRNDCSGWVGMKVMVGPTPLTVTALGRWMYAGNSQTHGVKIVRIGGGDVPGALVNVPLAGATPGQFRYVALSTPVILAANTAYYIVSYERLNADIWGDANTKVTPEPVAQCLGPVYEWQGVYYESSRPNQSFVPVDFKFVSSSAPTGAPLALAAAVGTSEFLEPADATARILGLRVLETRAVRLQIAGQAGQEYDVLGSTNLLDWVKVGSAIPGSNGLLELEDSDAASFSQRYYRVVIP